MRTYENIYENIYEDNWKWTKVRWYHVVRVQSPAKRSDDLSLNADLPGLLSHNLDGENIFKY